MNYTQIQYDVKDQVLIITLNRPEKLNAFTDYVMAPELIDAFDRADKDDDVRVIIVTGAGRGFCSGHDLEEGFDYDEQAQATLENHRDIGGIVALRIYEMQKPVIAAINGAAIGVGITMTLPMDIRLASEKAKIGFVFTRLGITLEACSNWFLPRIVGISKAAEWAYTGRIFDAREALAGGLISQVVPHDQLLEKAREIAQEIVQNTSAVSISLNRQLLWKMLEADHPMEAHKIESKCIYWLGLKPDSKEAVDAFHEKRPPKFTMKPSSDMPEFYPWWLERKFK
ncbi:MAG: crotonase/enoyl-CoA hydratase family protein [Deltaproteobacteria bacterium]|nr:crotonase/enoyl-CoA hydratase family protein [Deltaproteobacteria bacterium]